MAEEIITKKELLKVLEKLHRKNIIMSGEMRELKRELQAGKMPKWEKEQILMAREDFEI